MFKILVASLAFILFSIIVVIFLSGYPYPAWVGCKYVDSVESLPPALQDASLVLDSSFLQSEVYYVQTHRQIKGRDCSSFQQSTNGYLSRGIAPENAQAFGQGEFQIAGIIRHFCWHPLLCRPEDTQALFVLQDSQGGRWLVHPYYVDKVRITQGLGQEPTVEYRAQIKKGGQVQWLDLEPILDIEAVSRVTSWF